jgi:hypothetical protein
MGTDARQLALRRLSREVQRELTPSPPLSTERKSVTGGEHGPARDDLRAPRLRADTRLLTRRNAQVSASIRVGARPRPYRARGGPGPGQLHGAIRALPAPRGRATVLVQFPELRIPSS